jgi:hypothetical protein
VSKDIKVTDKRMFTPEGELREEYRDFFEKSTSEPEPAPEPVRAPTVAPPDLGQEPGRQGRFGAEPPAQPGWGFQEEPAGYGYEPEPPRGSAPPLDLPDVGMGGMGGMGGGPSFFDLVAMLAEPVAVYLGDVPLPDGQSAENLEMAHVHIDLLDVLRQKTAGNLSAQEAAFFEDLLYRLKVRYVQKTR